KVQQIKTELEGLLVKAHFEAKAAWDAGANDNEMNEALQLIRQSQWRWDFVAASHGGSFHSPLETARIIANGIIKAQQARLLLTKILFAHNITEPVKIPDISTKEKAQKYIGLDIQKLNKEKQEFLNNLAKKWKS
ncbi:MAG: ammonia-forming cytochrome c nitrite reductase subunit c552, partial [Bacteroidales bacterium]|nr:ammonia-forming cytochrome c nitrite reductase subunit c552 [Bacteroidales bacterium]